MNIKYLFFDYDGTLSDELKDPTPAVVQALNKAQYEGHKIFLCSGRCRAVKPQIKNVTFDGTVMSCGVDVTVGEKTVFHLTQPLESLRECAELSVRHGFPFVAECRNVAVTVHPIGDTLWGCPSVETFEEFAAQFGSTAEINKFSILGVCGEDIIRAAERNGYEYIDREISGEFVPKGHSKETGIQKVLDHYGADIADSIAFGDSLNDLGMIKYCGTGVVMGNASNTLKGYADFVTKSVSEDGVAYYINEILLKGENI